MKKTSAIWTATWKLIAEEIGLIIFTQLASVQYSIYTLQSILQKDFLYLKQES